MDDDTLSRRALVGGLAVGTAGIGVVYGAGAIGDDGGDVTRDVDVRASDRTVTLADTDDGPLTVDHSGTPSSAPPAPT